MAKTFGRYITALVFGLALLGTSISISLVSSSGSASAASCASNRGWCNNDEMTAYNLCGPEGQIIQGAIWMNNTGSAATTDGYYSTTISVAHNATTVDVYVRGSVQGCASGSYSNSYASRITITGSHSSRFTTVAGGLFRGTGQGPWRWSTQGGHATIRFNTTGLAPSTETSTGSQTIGIGIFRYFSNNGSDAVGSPRTAWQNITITRSKKPTTYNLVPSISTLPQTMEPGQAISVSGSVAKTGSQSGTSQTDTRYTRIIHKAGQSAPTNSSGGVSAQASCDYYGMTGGNSARCSSSAPSAMFTNYVFTGSGRAMTPLGDTVPEDFSPGDKICYGISVRGYNEITGPGRSSARHSPLRCVTVGKKPKVHVVGSDLYVGRGNNAGTVTTSVSATGRKDVPPAQSVIDEEVRNTQRYWFFGKGAGFHFGNSGTTVTPKTKNMTGDEGSTVATDRKGVVQFFTDGLNVYRPTGDVMDNGGSIGSTSTTTQAAASFPIQGNKYVVVTSSAASENNLLGDLRYTVVDMSANGGIGRVASKNQAFGPQGGVNRTGEAISIAPNVNRDGYWVVVNRPGTNVMRSFAVPFSWNGTNGSAFTPVDSATGGVSGSPAGVTHAPGFGTINFNADNNQAVVAMQRPSSGNGTVRVLNFNASNGTFSQRFEWALGDYYVYSADFSPSGNYVYVSSLYNPPGANGGNGHLFRYKISGMTTSAQVKASEYGVAFGATGMPACAASGGGGQVKRAPDGKMYVARVSCSSIGVINSPDAVANGGIGWNMSGRSLPSGAVSTFGLPQVAAVLPVSLNPPVSSRTNYGSWSEYGIAASNQIKRMSSGAGYANGIYQEGASLGNINFCSLSLLSFSNRNASNVCVDSGVGSYALPVKGTVIDKYAAMPASGMTQLTSTSVTPSSLGTAVYRPLNTSAITLNGGAAMPINRSVVIYAPNNDVIINGNLTYTTASMASASSIPQLVIIARNITVNESVSQVDAWLVTKTAGHGNLRTCNVVATSLTSSRCASKLTVNGPVISNKIHLLRTAGAGKDANALEAAEVFNLRPDAYLWGATQGGVSSRAPTADLIELPPRF